jgi:molybdate transport repressor ModE-like protein
MLRASMRRLDVFATAAEAGSFAAAAARLGIEQPSVSDHIRALEAELGQALFDRRRGRAARLTPAGEALLAQARRMLGDAAQLAAAAEAGRQAAGQRVVVACQRLLAHFVLPGPLAEFARRHPGIELAIRTSTQEEVLARLREGAVDLGCFLGQRALDGVDSRRIGTERVVLVAAPGHPLAGRRVAPGDLVGQAFVRGSRQSLVGREFDGMLRERGVLRTRTVAQTTEYAMARELVAAGAGVMIALLRGVRADLASGALVELQLDAAPMAIGVHLGMPRGRAPSAAARCLAEALGVAGRTAG